MTPRTRPFRIEYADVVASAIADTHGVRRARASPPASPAESVVIDPAHDFGKNTVQSLEVTRRLDELVATGWPVLVSLSNKDFVGETLDLGGGGAAVGTLAVDRGLCARGCADLPRARGDRDPAGRRHGAVDRRACVRPPGRSGGWREPARARRRRRPVDARAAPGVRRARGPGRRPAGRVPGGRRLAGRAQPDARRRRRRAAAARQRGPRRHPPGVGGRSRGTCSLEADFHGSHRSARVGGRARRRQRVGHAHREGARPPRRAGASPSTRRSARALREGDPRELSATWTRCWARSCGAHDVPAWQPAGRARSTEPVARCRWTTTDDPYGVQYWVVRWSCGS